MITTMIVMVLGTGRWLRTKNAFPLKAVRIEGAQNLDTEVLYRQLDVEFNRDIFDIEPEAIEKQLKENQMIRSVNVVRRIPSTLKIEVIERELVAAFHHGDEISGLDREGCFIPRISARAAYDLPILTGLKAASDMSTGGFVLPEELEAIAPFLYRLKTSVPHVFHAIAEVHFDRRVGFVLYLRWNSLPVVLGFDDYDAKGERFTVAYPRIERDFAWKNLTYIDLRFDAQVVVK